VFRPRSLGPRPDRATFVRAKTGQYPFGYSSVARRDTHHARIPRPRSL